MALSYTVHAASRTWTAARDECAALGITIATAVVVTIAASWICE